MSSAKKQTCPAVQKARQSRNTGWPAQMPQSCAKVPEAPRVKWELGLRRPARKLEGCTALPNPQQLRWLAAHAATKGAYVAHMGENPAKVKSMSHA
ncbi:MAG: hypothetical protein ACRCT6_08305 [Notoacmeibacter sp.]